MAPVMGCRSPVAIVSSGDEWCTECQLQNALMWWNA